MRPPSGDRWLDGAGAEAGHDGGGDPRGELGRTDEVREAAWGGRQRGGRRVGGSGQPPAHEGAAEGGARAGGGGGFGGGGGGHGGGRGPGWQHARPAPGGADQQRAE